mgnify:CR=1 FL=1|jgi:hypothetical protein|tara:strand:+ start:2347 stop:2874 length:528 start_codon:yes stop_codon:yes gene_type:complete
MKNSFQFILLIISLFFLENCENKKSYDHKKDVYVDTFDEPELALPYNGYVEYYSSPIISEAILTIKTPSGKNSTLVKLKNSLYKTDVLSVFIRPGQSVTIKVPLGSFKLYYASGEKWYGDKFLFGPNTIYSIADDIFTFKRTEDQYYEYFSQWTVELILRQYGNLETSRISASEF